MSIFEKYLEANTDQYLYHVTKTSNVDKIKKKGILMMQSTNWTNALGKRYGKGEIYAFEHQRDAVNWAAKMDWAFNTEMGSGKISIIKIRKKGKWVVDKNDPLGQVGSKGKWLKTTSKVEPEDIISSMPVTLTHTRKLVADEDIKDMFNEESNDDMVNTILKIIERKRGDVCQIGLEVAKEYTDSEEDYEKLWTLCQDIFDDDMEGRPYTLKDEVKEKYARKLANLIMNKKYKDVKIVEW